MTEPDVPLRGIVVLTGTDTGVGKTIVTASIAAAATAAGVKVSIVKPAQTGTTDGEEPDAATVSRLAGIDAVHTLTEFPDPLAPLAAARVAGQPALTLDDACAGVRDAAVDGGLTLVEGAGGLLVPMGERGFTVADLAVALGAPAVVVARPDLGTLNHTALTIEALERRGVPAVVVFGTWPAEPSLVHRTNATDIVGVLAGAVPAGAGALPPARFQELAPSWLSSVLYGHFDPAGFRADGC